MKLRDWITFNFKNNNFKCYIHDIVVKVYKQKEFIAAKDLLLESLMKIDDAAYLFGDFELVYLDTITTKDNYTTICVSIYQKQ